MPKLIDFDDVPKELEQEAQALIAAALAQTERGAHHKKQPLLIHMCGIPGSGKTTYTTKFLGASTERSFSLVQFDTVMESLSGYQRDRTNLGLERAFANWELPARLIGYHLLQALVEAKKDIFFDHSATNRKHIELIRAAQKRGYQVEMHFIDCSIEEATKRVLAREAELQRHTPLSLISERSQLLEELLPEYEALVDKFIRATT